MNFKLLIFSCSCFILLMTSCRNESKLPVLGKEGSRIPAFSFLNQDSTKISEKTFDDHIYIADFFFTSCSSICPVMHRNMKEIYEQYKDTPELMFLSHTIDFKHDTPSKLKKYAQKLGVDGPAWQFAYGSKESIYKIAQNNYLVAVVEDNSTADGYMHQGWLVLIDKEKRIRGAYDGTDDAQVEQLKKDVSTLIAEYKL